MKKAGLNQKRLESLFVQINSSLKSEVVLSINDLKDILKNTKDKEIAKHFSSK